jgi:hypothetical protein
MMMNLKIKSPGFEQVTMSRFYSEILTPSAASKRCHLVKE